MNLTGSAKDFHNASLNLNISMKYTDSVNTEHESTAKLRNKISRNIHSNSNTRRNLRNDIRNADPNKYSRTVKRNIVYTINRL